MGYIAMIVLVLAAATWLSAAGGAAFVAFVRKENGTFTYLVLGLAAGVILMVSFTELLHPAIHIAQDNSSFPVWVIVPGAFVMGFVSTMVLDGRISKIKERQEKSGRGNLYKQGLMLFCALSVHNIPEGLALGILLGGIGGLRGSAGRGDWTELWAVVPLVAAIALHKFPEGAAISVAFQKEGLSKLKSFLVGQTSGLFGFIAGIIGFGVAVNIDGVLPYAMAFAGGAMVWVAVHELIPECKKRNENQRNIATLGICLGVLMMLFVDITLHDHSHPGHHHGNHGHQCGEHCLPDIFILPPIIIKE